MAKASTTKAAQTKPAAAKPGRTLKIPDTTSGMPETVNEDPKPESNPFTTSDWRMLSYAWLGLSLRVLLFVGALFSGYQYLENKEADRVERTLQLVELWEKQEYQDAQRAVSERLDALNAKYASLLGASPTPSERQVYMERIGSEAMTETGGTQPLADFRAAFDRTLYFLNRMSFCVEGGLCSRSVVDEYFGDFALSFWTYFRGHILAERKTGSATFGAPLEKYIAGLRHG